MRCLLTATTSCAARSILRFKETNTYYIKKKSLKEAIFESYELKSVMLIMPIYHQLLFRYSFSGKEIQAIGPSPKENPCYSQSFDSTWKEFENCERNEKDASIPSKEICSQGIKIYYKMFVRSWNISKDNKDISALYSRVLFTRIQVFESGVTTGNYCWFIKSGLLS